MEITKAKINREIKDLGLTIEGRRGDGCFYFIDGEGNQIGETVMVCYLSHLTLYDWIGEARIARRGGVPLTR